MGRHDDDRRRPADQPLETAQVVAGRRVVEQDIRAAMGDEQAGHGHGSELSLRIESRLAGIEDHIKLKANDFLVEA